MEFNISPLDNRYKNKCDLLREYVSDFGFNKIRYEVELKYFEFLLNILYKFILKVIMNFHDYLVLMVILIYNMIVM